MTIGIQAYGAYVPYYRLSRSAIGEAFGAHASSGERAIAAYDEDTASMAVAAALNAVRSKPDLPIDALFFATTTAPYLEKQSATLIGAALDLSPDIQTAEFGATLRAGTSALLNALDTAAAGKRSALVVAADMRLGGPGGSLEASIGDAAAAIVVGAESPVAVLVGSKSTALDIVDVWREPGGRHVHEWDERFQLERGYGRAIPRVVKAVLAQAQLGPCDVSRVVLPLSTKASPILLAMGFRRDQLEDNLATTVGLTGAAHPLLMFVKALESGSPGDVLLLLGYGEGADALLFRVEGAIQQFRPTRSVAQLVESKRHTIPYARYLSWRQEMRAEPPRRPEPSRPSAPVVSRTGRSSLALYGSRCEACGTPQFPTQRECYRCGARERMYPYRFRDRCGWLSAFSADHLAYSLNPPEVFAVVDFEGGGRILCNMADVVAEELTIGERVEMSFRRLFTAGGIHSYFWKAQRQR